MEWRQMEYVVAVARRGLVTPVAEELHVAQSALSRQIQQVERELGVQLFDRAGRRLRPTAAGAAFVARAERLLADREALRDEMRAFAGGERGQVRVGVLPSLAQVRLPALLVAFHRRHPGVEVALHEGATTALIGQLDAGRLDLALVHQLAGLYPAGQLPRGLAVEDLFTEDLVLIAEPASASVPPAPTALGDLAPAPFIAFAPGFGLRHTLLQASAAAGFAPWIAFESAELATVRALAAAGLGVALVPRSAMEVDGPPVRVVTLAPPAPTRTVSLAYPAGRYRPAAVATFLAFVRERMGGAQGPPTAL